MKEDGVYPRISLRLLYGRRWLRHKVTRLLPLTSNDAKADRQALAAKCYASNYKDCD